LQNVRIYRRCRARHSFIYKAEKVVPFRQSTGGFKRIIEVNNLLKGDFTMKQRFKNLINEINGLEQEIESV